MLHFNRFGHPVADAKLGYADTVCWFRGSSLVVFRAVIPGGLYWARACTWGAAEIGQPSLSFFFIFALSVFDSCIVCRLGFEASRSKPAQPFRPRARRATHRTSRYRRRRVALIFNLNYIYQPTSRRKTCTITVYDRRPRDGRK